jgi:HAD superfamily hydrolase (TIGR01509 family)
MVTPAWDGAPPLAAVVDLDDTLYPQAAYLAGAVVAVSDRAAALGLDQDAFHQKFAAALAEGSDMGGTIDRALAGLGFRPDEAAVILPALVFAFTGFRPARLTCYPGAREALAELATRLPVACLTDGAPDIQRAKLAALGLDNLFRFVVITDELGGRPARKPHPAGLTRAAELLGVAPAALIVIGDRPTKDVAVAAACGARAIRVRQGEYAGSPDVPMPWASVADFPSAVRVALQTLGAQAAVGGW